MSNLCPQASFARRSVRGHRYEGKLSPMLWHRRPQEEFERVRAAACWATQRGSPEAQVRDVYARSETTADLAKELSGDGYCHGIDRAVLAAFMEFVGRRIRQAGS